MDRITPGLEIGLATDAISGSHLILTAAGVDTHIHFISPQQAQAALSNGTTTLIGGGTGPSDGSNATTVTSGPGNIHMMLRAFEGWPINVGILGKGHGHGKAALVEQIDAGAVGVKCHEDWGTTPPCHRAHRCGRHGYTGVYPYRPLNNPASSKIRCGIRGPHGPLFPY
jgi:urease subunit alpha